MWAIKVAYMFTGERLRNYIVSSIMEKYDYLWDIIELGKEYYLTYLEKLLKRFLRRESGESRISRRICVKDYQILSEKPDLEYSLVHL